MLLVRRARVSARAWCDPHGGGLCWRPHALASDVRSGSHGHDGPRRDGGSDLRPAEGLLRAACRPLLAAPRPHLAQPAGRRRGHAVPLGHLVHLGGAARRRRGLARQAACRRQAQGGHTGLVCHCQGLPMGGGRGLSPAIPAEGWAGSDDRLAQADPVLRQPWAHQENGQARDQGHSEGRVVKVEWTMLMPQPECRERETRV
mmetsp:Transcript_32919/g.77842  ORF Transcript_32919/g.77842 Transcript_32919/m.77842 type:complete len:202 (+) Transcript_32919:173-778(+)